MTTNKHSEFRPLGDAKPGVKLELKGRAKHYEGKAKHLRVFIEVSGFPEGVEIQDLISGESPETAREHRNDLKHRKKMTRALRNFLCEEFDLPDAKLQFNAYTGCGLCPCSPGWQLKGELPEKLKYGKYVRINLNYLPGA